MNSTTTERGHQASYLSQQGYTPNLQSEKQNEKRRAARTNEITTNDARGELPILGSAANAARLTTYRNADGGC